MFLRSDVGGLADEHLIECKRLADMFELVDDLLYYVGGVKRRDDQGRLRVRLVAPATLHSEVLHHYHASMAGGHQGVTRTYEKTKRSVYWRHQYRDVRDYVPACSDCQPGEGEPRVSGSSPGNLVATYPLEILGMDHVPSLPRSHRGKTELLLRVDHHTGYVMASANDGRDAQMVAEAYERQVYRRFGASRVIRHDREPAFTSEVMRASNRLIGQRSRATLAYRPQSNGMTERMVQTIVHAIKLYVADPNQRDWDDYAERLVFAINSSYDRIRKEIPHYVMHGWSPRTTLETTLPDAEGDRRHASAAKWRASIQSQYLQARDHAAALLQRAMEERRDQANERDRGDDGAFVAGTHVWLYVNQVKTGFSKKLAHLWHRPFCVLERVADNAVKLEVEGTRYRFFPVVHVARLKLWREYEERPMIELATSEVNERFDFDEALLPEDSFEPNNEDGVYEVEEIVDHRDVRTARQGRPLREYKVRWVGYEEPTWVREDNLNAPALLDEYERRLRARGRFAVMATEDE